MECLRFPVVAFLLKYSYSSRIKGIVPLYSLYQNVLNPGETLESFV